MKVLENLENYDIPSGFRLSAEQEMQLASDLKEIVEALIPIRNSKLKTRTFFNQHLRYSSNVIDFQSLPDSPPDVYENGQHYTPLPEEYTWNSDLLQPALLDILKHDYYCFGYVINYINEDIARRKGQRVPTGSIISDGSVKFFNEFDIDEIRAKAKDIEDIHDRILYLNKVYTDYQVFDELSEDEENWLAPDVGRAIKSLQEEAQKELEIAQSRGDKHSNSKNKGNGSSTPLPGRIDPYSPARGMLYDFAICSETKFVPLKVESPEGWYKTAFRNVSGMEALLKNKFATCFDPNRHLERDKNTYELLPVLLVHMQESYAHFLKETHKFDERKLIIKNVAWVSKTRQLIEKAYISNPIIYSEDDPYEVDGELVYASDDTTSLKYILLKDVYSAAWYFVEDIAPLMPDCFSDIVPYNMWGDSFDSLRKEYTGQFGLESKKRAVVNVSDNKALFTETIKDKFVLYCNQRNIEGSFGDTGAIDEQLINSVTEQFHSLFRDYLSRLKKISKDEDEIDNALILWFLELQSMLALCYSSNHVSLELKTSYPYEAKRDCLFFFFDVCEKVAYDIATGYFEDYERLNLIPDSEENNDIIPPGTVINTINLAQLPQSPQSDNKLHKCLIDYDKLYDELNSIAFYNISPDEFKRAIDEADFAVMLQRATDAGQKKGYIGSVKFLMKCLRPKLGSHWYEVACDSIKSTPSENDKQHKDTARNKSIPLEVLNEYIKPMPLEVR